MLERAQQGDGLGEFGGGLGGFEAGEAAAFEQDVVAVAVEHEALAVDLDRGDVFGGGERLDAGDVQQIGGSLRQAAEAVAPGVFQRIDGLFGAGFGEFAVGGDAELGFPPAMRRAGRRAGVRMLNAGASESD